MSVWVRELQARTEHRFYRHRDSFQRIASFYPAQEKEIYHLIYRHALQSKKIISLMALSSLKREDREAEEEERRKVVANAVLDECRKLIHSTALQVQKLRVYK